MDGLRFPPDISRDTDKNSIEKWGINLAENDRDGECGVGEGKKTLPNVVGKLGGFSHPL